MLLLPAVTNGIGAVAEPATIVVGTSMGLLVLQAQMLEQAVANRTERSIFLSPAGRHGPCRTSAGSIHGLGTMLVCLATWCCIWHATSATKICRQKGIEFARRLRKGRKPR